MNMASMRNVKKSLRLYSRDRVALTEPTIFDMESPGEDLVLKMVEEGLNVLGENVGKVILHHLEVRYSLKRNQIAEKPDLFVKVLADMFGEGSLTIERIIVETINRKTGISLGKRLCEIVRRLRGPPSYTGPRIYR